MNTLDALELVMPVPSTARVHCAFVVPGVPVPKERARSGGGHFYTPEATRAFAEQVQWVATLARCKPLPKGTDVMLVLAFLGAEVGDFDNLEKAVADALNKVAYVDDRQVVRSHTAVYRADDNPRTVVAIYELEASA